MTPDTRRLDSLEEDVELLAAHRDGADLDQYAEYEGDPVGFAEEVLDQDLTSDQREALKLLASEDRVAWQAAQAVGKSRCIAVAALWWAYCRQGQVLISAPTARTVQEVIMRKELARLWRPRPELKGDLFTNSLRIKADEPAVLAYTATSASGATGQHDPEGGVLAILDEAQGVPPEVWVAMDANTTGSRDKQFVCGNPVRPAGDFYEVCQDGSGWAVIETSALDHPNLDTGSDREVPGGPSPDWLGRMRDRWGEDSPQWQARVLGQFPEQSRDALIRRSWLDHAASEWERGPEEPSLTGEPLTVGVDVARTGQDSNAAAVRQGSHVFEVVTWTADDLMDSVDNIERLLHRHSGANRPKVGELVVDSAGLGAGLADRLKERVKFMGLKYSQVGAARKRIKRYSPDVTGFNSSTRASDPDRFVNLRAEVFWTLRERLEEGDLALPPDEELHEELWRTSWKLGGGDKVQIEPKENIQTRLGRSPDRADAVAMSLATDIGEQAKEAWFV